MADLRNQQRMAADLLKCGKNRVWMDHDRIDEIAKAVTKEDIRLLIRGKAIKAEEKATAKEKALNMQGFLKKKDG